MKKIIILSLFLLLAPNIAQAQLDQRCWTQKKCIDQRKLVNINLSEEEIADGFYQGSEAVKACGGRDGKTTDAGGEEIGFCLPVTQTVTKISFGGRNRFDNIGVFIQYMYRYSITFAGVLAVVMLIIAGFTWMTSGGNPERITSAKKRIAGSLMGLFLAIMSYSILNLLNPALVNLRLPNTWMINTQGLAPPNCVDIVGNKKVHELTTYDTNPKQKQKLKDEFIDSESPEFETNPKEAQCNLEYVVPNTGGQTCLGTFCEEKYGRITTCALPPEKDAYECFGGNIVGTIYNSNPLADNPFADIFTENWEWGSKGWVPGEMDVGVVCNNGDMDAEIAEIPRAQIKNDKSKTQFYYIPVSEGQIKAAEKKCAGYGIKGFFLDLSFNEAIGGGGDEDHFIGKKGVDLGDWEVGITDRGAFVTQIRYKDISQYLISLEELKEGIRIDINASDVCDVDNSEEDTMRERCYGYLGFKNKSKKESASTSSGSKSSGTTGGTKKPEADKNSAYDDVIF